MRDSKERFSDRVDNYVKFRPTYPAEAVDCMIEKSRADEKPNFTVADLGAGTGKFSRLLVERKLNVIAVEPNKNMREAAENELSGYENYTSISASAEETGLESHSVDLITAAQAFHWFDREKCKVEFERILKRGGQVALIWNRRDVSVPFMAEYTDITYRYAVEPPNETYDHEMNSQTYGGFFEGGYNEYYFRSSQKFDFDGMWGRAQSSSYSPPENHGNHIKLRDALKNLFEKYNKNGFVDFGYVTEVIIGKMTDI